MRQGGQVLVKVRLPLFPRAVEDGEEPQQLRPEVGPVDAGVRLDEPLERLGGRVFAENAGVVGE